MSNPLISTNVYPPTPPPPPVVLVTPLATRKNRFAPAHRAPKNLYKDTVLYYTVYIHITSEMQVIMSSSSEEECDGAWSRGVVEPYQCEPLAKPRAPKPPLRRSQRSLLIVVSDVLQMRRDYSHRTRRRLKKMRRRMRRGSRLSGMAEVRVFMNNRLGQFMLSVLTSHKS
jgi:hypothetical protein